MNSWPKPAVPRLPEIAQSLQLQDTRTASILPVTVQNSEASLYVCGITPYDATHLGHANTYVQFDLLVRLWRAAGLTVTYVQNVTDVDDPLLERAESTGVDWRELAEEQTELFRTDMTALGVIPPQHYVGAVESVPQVVAAVERLRDLGIAYPVSSEEADDDWYFDSAAAQARSNWTLGSIGGYDRSAMEELFPQRGGDPQRQGKRDPLDPLLWLAHREGEPQWDGGSLGVGRPGWHIECSVIAREYLPTPFTVQGGGSDLRFPHHEFSAAHATAADGADLAQYYVHTAMVGLNGEKMSKSQGNLVLVSKLREAGEDPQAIRVLLLDQHFSTDWSYTDEALRSAKTRLDWWKQRWAQLPAQGSEVPDQPEELQYAIYNALSLNLNAPAALALLDQWADGDLAVGTGSQRVREVVLALLGVDLGA